MCCMVGAVTVRGGECWEGGQRGVGSAVAKSAVTGLH